MNSTICFDRNFKIIREATSFRVNLCGIIKPSKLIYTRIDLERESLVEYFPMQVIHSHGYPLLKLMYPPLEDISQCMLSKLDRQEICRPCIYSSTPYTTRLNILSRTACGQYIERYFRIDNFWKCSLGEASTMTMYQSISWPSLDFVCNHFL